jgi:PTH1 family peptidyl-tRNA hydrolase
MQLVIGIGNPGRQYTDTRHNLGWSVLDLLVSRHRLGVQSERRFQADLADWRRGEGLRCLLVKPQTFVNRSGETVQALAAFHRVPIDAILVVVDDINLPTGTLRLRGGGSAGGHNGLKDIETRLGAGYARLRLGCGPLPPGSDQVGFVLGGFPPEERPVAERMIARAADAVEGWLNDGVAVACRFNGDGAPPKPRPPRPVPTSTSTSIQPEGTPSQIDGA